LYTGQVEAERRRGGVLVGGDVEEGVKRWTARRAEGRERRRVCMRSLWTRETCLKEVEVR
jgi:hypothetical protein